MQKRDPFGCVLIQSAQLPKVTNLFPFSLRPFTKLCKRTTLPWSALTIWDSSDAIVDIEPNELLGNRGLLRLAGQQLEDDTATHRRNLRLAPFAMWWNVSRRKVFLVVDNIESCHHWGNVAVMHTEQ